MPAHAMQCTIIVHVAKITKFIYRHNFTAEISEAKMFILFKCGEIDFRRLCHITCTLKCRAGVQIVVEEAAHSEEEAIAFDTAAIVETLFMMPCRIACKARLCHRNPLAVNGTCPLVAIAGLAVDVTHDWVEVLQE